MSYQKRLVAVLLAVIFALFVLTVTAQALNLKGRGSLSFSAGQLLGDTLFEGFFEGIPLFSEMDDGSLFMFRGEADFTNNIGIEFGIGGATNDLIMSSPGVATLEVDMEAVMLNGGIVVNVPIGRLVPFVAGGVGLVNFSSDEAFIDETDLSVNFGGGVKIYVTDHFFFRVDARDHLTFPEDTPDMDLEDVHLIELSGGVGVTF